jgi:hypothetical protein
MSRPLALPDTFSQRCAARLVGRNRKSIARYVAAGTLTTHGPRKQISRVSLERYLGRPIEPVDVYRAMIEVKGSSA